VIIKDLRNKINQLMNDAYKIVQQPAVSSEDRAKVDAMFSEVDQLEAQASQLERIEKWEADQRSIVVPPRPQPGTAGAGSEGSEEERKQLDRRAMLQYLQGGMGNVDADLRNRFRSFIGGNGEKRDLTTTTGAQLIPQLFYPLLIEAIKFYGPIMDLVTVRRTENNGAPMKYALDNDTANSISVLGEATTVSEVDSTFSGSLLSTDTATTGLIKISEQELADSYFDLDAWVRGRFGIRLGRGLENWITNGNASNVASLLTSATVAATAAGAGGTGQDGGNSIGYDDITAVYSYLDPGYEANATWMMTSKTRGFLMGVKDLYGRPLFIPNPSSGAFDMLLGRPVKLNQSLPQIGDSNKTVLYGDFSQGYLFRVDGDLAIKRLNERFADALEVGFIGYLRCGGVATDAGTHPVVVLQQAAS